MTTYLCVVGEKELLAKRSTHEDRHSANYGNIINYYFVYIANVSRTCNMLLLESAERLILVHVNIN